MSAATDGRVYARHPETGGEALVSAEPDVVALYEAKGWVVSDEVPAHLDPDAPDTAPAAEAPEPEPADGPAEDSPASAPAETTDDPAPADLTEEE